MFEFKLLKEEHLALVLEWRLKPSVSKFLFTEVENNFEKHQRWFKKVSQDSSYKYWVIYFHGRPIGVFNLSNLDLQNSRTNAGYYIGEEDAHHLGGLIPPYFYNYVFHTLKLNKIYGEVVDGNSILKMHQLHGYRIVGTFKSHIRKNEVFHDVHAVELLADIWKSQKRYQSYTASFEE